MNEIKLGDVVLDVSAEKALKVFGICKYWDGKTTVLVGPPEYEKMFLWVDVNELRRNL